MSDGCGKRWTSDEGVLEACGWEYAYCEKCLAARRKAKPTQITNPTQPDTAKTLEANAHLTENIAHNLQQRLTPAEIRGLLEIAQDMRAAAGELRELRKEDPGHE